MANDKIRVRLRAFDVALIDQSAKDIVQQVQKAGAKVSGPIPFQQELIRLQFFVHLLLTRSHVNSLRCVHTNALLTYSSPVLK